MLTIIFNPYEIVGALAVIIDCSYISIKILQKVSE